MNALFKSAMLVIALFLGVFTPAKSSAAVTFRLVSGVRHNGSIYAGDLVGPTPLVTTRMVVPPEVVPSATVTTVMGTALGLFPEENGVPIVLTSVTIKEIKFSVVKKNANGSVVSRYYDSSPVTNWGHESATPSGCVFTTPDSMSVVPNSPADGLFKNKVVSNVGGIFLTRKDYKVGPAPAIMRPPTLGQWFEFEYEFNLNYVHNSVTYALAVTKAQTLMTYKVSDVKPQIKVLRPAPINGDPDCLEIEGDNVSLWQLEFAPTPDAQYWTLVSPTTPGTQRAGNWCHWNAPRTQMHPPQTTESRFFRLRFTPTGSPLFPATP